MIENLLPSSDTKPFYVSLERLRGVAALMVALFHVSLTEYTDSAGHVRNLITREHGSLVERSFWILGNGPGAVILFFGLSGFVLTLVLNSRPLGTEAEQASTFLVSRVFRLYPAVFSSISLMASVNIIWHQETSTWHRYLLNALLIESSINSVTWSLQLELCAAPMVLLIFLAYKRWSMQALYIPYIIFFGLSFVGFWNHLIGPPNSFGQLYTFVPGMIAFLHGPSIVKRLKHPRLILIGCIVLFALARPTIGWSSYWTIFVESTLGAIIIALLAFAPSRPIRGKVQNILQFYGRISFSFYLLHGACMHLLPPLLPSIQTLINLGYSPVLMSVTLFVLTTIAVTPVALFQYRYVELLFIRWGKLIILHRAVLTI